LARNNGLLPTTHTHNLSLSLSFSSHGSYLFQVPTCPPNASGVPCICNSGFVDTLVWSNTTQQYTGACSGQCTLDSMLLGSVLKVIVLMSGADFFSRGPAKQRMQSSFLTAAADSTQNPRCPAPLARLGCHASAPKVSRVRWSGIAWTRATTANARVRGGGCIDEWSCRSHALPFICTPSSCVLFHSSQFTTTQRSPAPPVHLGCPVSAAMTASPALLFGIAPITATQDHAAVCRAELSRCSPLAFSLLLASRLVLSFVRLGDRCGLGVC
jgi:hypothetical protein